jgi:hypothetical protein
MSINPIKYYKGILFKIVVLALCLLFLAGCSITTAQKLSDSSIESDSAKLAKAVATTSPLPNISSVDVYTGMQSQMGTPLYTFNESAQVKFFQDAIDHAEKLPGMADMPSSDYTAVLHYEDNDKRMYIWVSERSASLMYDNESGTLYKVDYDYAIKLCELLLTGGQTEDISSLEAKNDIISMKVFEANYDGVFLYIFTNSSNTLIFYSAMKQASKLEGIPSMEAPDYMLDLTTTNGCKEVMLWLGSSDAHLQYKGSPDELYRVRNDDFARLSALFGEYVVPVEELASLRNTEDIDLILKYPAADISNVQPVHEGLGCWTAGNREAMDALLSSAVGKVEFILPSDASLTLEKAILRNCSDISVYYRDAVTGNSVIYSAVNGNRDIYPWGMGWKEAEINGYSLFKMVLDRSGFKATLLYLQHEGWTIIEQIIGDAGKADLERCFDLDIYSWNDGKPLMEAGKPLIEGKGNIDESLTAGAVTFEQHHNSYYQSVHTSKLVNLERFLSERLGFKEYYYYDGSGEELPLDSVNVENDGEGVTFLLGDISGDEYKSFSFTTGGCPSFLGEVNITAHPNEINDFGSLTQDGVTYFYSVIQNNKKYITNIAWEKDGIRFSISTRSSRLQAVDIGVITDWVSHVKRVPLGRE